jgi:hypothetical protein
MNILHCRKLCDIFASLGLRKREAVKEKKKNQEICKVKKKKEKKRNPSKGSFV